MNTHESSAATRAASSAHHMMVGRRCRRFFALVSLTVFLVVLLSILFTPQPVRAQGGTPPNQPRRGLVYDGLTRSERAKCQNGFDVHLGFGKSPLCTHGPDPVPAPLVGESTVSPLQATTATQVMCDGDGASGKRFQVVYARAADMPDRFATYQNSIQQWVIGADDILNASAAETGSTRHFRFVHDANCNPVVLNVILSPTGDDTFGNLLGELQTQGFKRADRNYVVFTDASIYCGIGTITSDDSAGASNFHNTGSFYARVDARCWSSSAVAHEMMHNLGGVQMSAPHTSNYWHCTDEHDLMCYQDSGSTVLQYLCDSTQSGLFDCNKEDYFNTNPAPNSYLATHWNTAFNEFLVYPREQIAVQSLTTGKLDRNGNFVATNTFKPRQTIVYRAMVQNASGAPVANARVSLKISQPDGIPACSYTGTTDASGLVSSSCPLVRNAPLGTWQLQVVSVEKPGAQFDMTLNTTHPFRVRTR